MDETTSPFFARYHSKKQGDVFFHLVTLASAEQLTPVQNRAQYQGVKGIALNVYDPCPLCRSSDITDFFQDKPREYLRCQICKLIYVPSRFHVSAAREKAEYDLHQNSPTDVGYRKFLSRLKGPVIERIAPGSRGLDFGCGPGPTLSVMFEEAGHTMEIFDPIYANDNKNLDQRYDFVTATEVVEHFRQPSNDLNRMWSLVKPGGLLGLMTKLAIDREAFSRWHYKDDCTHVAFYSRETFRWLADSWNAGLSLSGKDVILLSRK